ncbi:HAD family hydrolase [Roseisalinus antarcticus]|uniref:phosphoglycolate phosphatase n=1 Tax=Roseisalinus antarcticus TaxID=254357 RepID=A0A1Y5S226_9RHOB|nr:HAD family hydrolase [Roseisalinus antarcticus]SLN28167.1 Phosphoglycolate phosphatase [Roseisalinus antarcticus]
MSTGPEGRAPRPNDGPGGPVTLAGVVFDKDGTLYDFNATWGSWTMGLLTEEAGGDPDTVAALAEMLGYDTGARRFRRDSIVVAHTADEVAEVILPLLPPQPKSALVARMNARAATAPQVEAVDLGPFLDGLAARGLALGVATNDAEAPARAHLATSGIEARFRFIAGADSGFGHKPGPGQLVAFCQAVGLAPGAVVMVGDSAHDLLAGRAAGMVCVGVLTGLATRADLAPLADVVLPSIAGLPAWLDAQP